MSDAPAAGFGESQAPGRREDARLLTGRGRFTDDYTTEGQLHGVFLRSPMGHAEIRAVDTRDAASAPDVRGIFTCRDLASLGPLPCLRAPVNRNGDGQMHGGIVQGAGQVLSEFCRYDAAGQLLSGTFMDYSLPRAADYPAFALDFHTVPCTTNALGVKGAGESGTIGALPAVANAVADALRGLGIESFDMPAMSERIWRLLQNTR